MQGRPRIRAPPPQPPAKAPGPGSWSTASEGALEDGRPVSGSWHAHLWGRKSLAVVCSALTLPDLWTSHAICDMRAAHARTRHGGGGSRTTLRSPGVLGWAALALAIQCSRPCSLCFPSAPPRKSSPWSPFFQLHPVPRKALLGCLGPRSTGQRIWSSQALRYHVHSPLQTEIGPRKVRRGLCQKGEATTGQGTLENLGT